MKKVIMVLWLVSLIFTCNPIYGAIKTSEDFGDFFEPFMIAVDNDYLYVSQREHIFVFDVANLKLISKFGKLGDGPQEFRPIPGMGVILYPQKEDILVANAQGKILYYTKKGKYIKEIPIKGMAIQMPMFQPLPNGESFAGLGSAFDSKAATILVTNCIFDNNFKPIKEISSIALLKGQKMVFPMPSPRIIYSIDDNVIVNGSGNGFEFIISDTAGKELTRFKRTEPLLKVTEQYKTDLNNFMKQKTGAQWAVVKNMISFSHEYPPFQDLHAQGGKIYILTYLTEKGKAEFFVYTTKGTFEKRYMMPFVMQDAVRPAPWTVYKNSLYQLIETGNEEFELHINPFK